MQGLDGLDEGRDDLADVATVRGQLQVGAIEHGLLTDVVAQMLGTLPVTAHTRATRIFVFLRIFIRSIWCSVARSHLDERNTDVPGYSLASTSGP